MQVESQQHFKNMNAELYKNTYNTLYKTYPRWKQVAIVEDIKNKNDSGILLEFIQNVISTAEKQFDSMPVETQLPISQTMDVPSSKLKKPKKIKNKKS